ncbi:hypothetical protein FRX31_031032 [Thalictrum thalictroides]|uniref:Uncharacterized protein n=1 Tax=Thalictrum thalictroides TaxID=46969 RepID=A0A7J6V3P5_THATH|nr:hypothetical protein FRX31_031032 [Thalictrum thalictroides]
MERQVFSQYNNFGVDGLPPPLLIKPVNPPLNEDMDDSQEFGAVVNNRRNHLPAQLELATLMTMIQQLQDKFTKG